MRLFRAPTQYPSGGGGTREAEGTDCRVNPGRAQQHAQAYRGTLCRASKHQVRRGRRAARSSTSRGNPCARESKARTGRFLVEKLISDHDLFSSYDGQLGAANGQHTWGVYQGCTGL